MPNTITSIETQSGVTASTGKSWTRYIATLDDGRRASSFNFAKPGDVVEVEQKGEFLNFRKTNGAPPANRPKFMGGEVVQDDPRHYLMRSANLLLLCHNAAKATLGEGYTGEDARTLFIDAQRQGYVKQMPDKPVAQFPVEEDRGLGLDPSVPVEDDDQIPY